MSITIWQRVKTALTGLGIPMAAGKFVPSTGSVLPDMYIVYFLIVAMPEQFADDVEESRTNQVQINLFDRSGFTSMPDIDGAMKAAGFTPGPVRSIPENQNSQHFGLALEFTYLDEV